MGPQKSAAMADEDTAVYDDIALQAMDFDAETSTYTHACPCGDMFVISVDELKQGETIAHCNDCSLVIRVLLDAAARRLLGMDGETADPARGAGIEAAHELAVVM